MEQIYRFFAEKREGFDVEAQNLGTTLKTYLHLDKLKQVRIINRYDIAGLKAEYCEKAANLIISEPQCDYLYQEEIPAIDGEYQIFAVESLRGQYDQRADSAGQCLQVIAQGDKPLVKAAKVYVLLGEISAEELAKVKEYLINPVECREAALEKPQTLEEEITPPEKTFAIAGFIDGDDAFLERIL